MSKRLIVVEIDAEETTCGPCVFAEAVFSEKGDRMCTNAAFVGHEVTNDSARFVDDGRIEECIAAEQTATQTKLSIREEATA